MGNIKISNAAIPSSLIELQPAVCGEKGTVRVAQFRRLQNLPKHQPKIRRLLRVSRQRLTHDGEDASVRPLFTFLLPDFLGSDSRFQPGFAPEKGVNALVVVS